VWTEGQSGVAESHEKNRVRGGIFPLGRQTVLLPRKKIKPFEIMCFDVFSVLLISNCSEAP